MTDRQEIADCERQCKTAAQLCLCMMDFIVGLDTGREIMPANGNGKVMAKFMAKFFMGNVEKMWKYTVFYDRLVDNAILHGCG